MDWETVFKTVGISGILIVVIGFVLRSLFKQILSLDLANHQNDLDKQIVSFKAELDKTAFEHQTRFSLLHEKRAEIIAELYNRLCQVEKQVNSLMTQMEFDGASYVAEQFKDANESIGALNAYFIPYKIWFAPNICKKISNLTDALKLAVDNIMVTAISDEQGFINNRTWHEAFEKTYTEIPKLKFELEKEFRGILGIGQEKTE